MSKSILIFPANMQQSLQYFRQAQLQNIKIVGASSIDNDPVSKKFDEWIQLPYISDDNFKSTLMQIINDYNVGGIYTPHMVIWDHLNSLINNDLSDVVLVNYFPFDEESGKIEAAQSFANHLYQKKYVPHQPLLPKLSYIEASALFQHSEQIFGQCAYDKLLALCEIYQYAVKGDMVEIGAFCGKSAFVLAWLGRHYHIGKLLCIDPWSFKESVDQDDESGLLSQAAPRLNLEHARQLFEINLLPYNVNHINYLQMTSMDASKQYDENLLVSNHAFGETSYSGKISILHIDGNHSYQAARTDIQSWLPKLVCGGWLIVDDYDWPFGDGPKRAGDELLSEQKDSIDTYFIAGGALFIKWSK